MLFACPTQKYLPLHIHLLTHPFNFWHQHLTSTTVIDFRPAIDLLLTSIDCQRQAVVEVGTSELAKDQVVDVFVHVSCSTTSIPITAARWL